MLAQVTYIQKMCCCKCRFCGNVSQDLPAGRRAGVGRPAISNILDTAGRSRAGIGSTPADAMIFGTHITDARPMPHDDRPMQNRPVVRLSEFPALVAHHYILFAFWWLVYVI